MRSWLRYLVTDEGELGLDAARSGAARWGGSMFTEVLRLRDQDVEEVALGDEVCWGEG